MGPHKNLLVWQKGMLLTKKIYALTTQYPPTETFGLVSQMRRCAVSIPSNIAEGYGRGSNKELVHFLYVAKGSANELDTQLILSRELGYITDEKYSEISELNEEVNKMISSLILKRNVVVAEPT